MKPLISVVMPSYNSESYIRYALDTIVLQSLKNIELVLVDGGSTDRTLEIVDEYKTQFSIVVVSEKDRGVNDAFRKGLSLCKGDYICALPSTDGYFDPNYLKSCVEKVTQTPDLSAILAASAFEISEDSSPLYQYHPWKLSFFQFIPEAHHAEVCRRLGVLLPDMGFFISKECMNSIFPEEHEGVFGLDVTYLGVLRNLYRSSFNFVVLPRIASVGRHHDGQFTYAVSRSQLLGKIIFYQEAWLRLFNIFRHPNYFLYGFGSMLIYFIFIILYGGLGYYFKKICSYFFPDIPWIKKFFTWGVRNE